MNGHAVSLNRDVEDGLNTDFDQQRLLKQDAGQLISSERREDAEVATES